MAFSGFSPSFIDQYFPGAPAGQSVFTGADFANLSAGDPAGGQQAQSTLQERTKGGLGEDIALASLAFMGGEAALGADAGAAGTAGAVGTGSGAGGFDFLAANDAALSGGGSLAGAAGVDTSFTGALGDLGTTAGLGTGITGIAPAGATDFLGDPLAGNTFNLGNSAQGVVPDASLNALGVPGNSLFLDATTPTTPVSGINAPAGEFTIPNPNAPAAGSNVGFEDPVNAGIGDTGSPLGDPSLGDGEGVYDPTTDTYTPGSQAGASGLGQAQGLYNPATGTYTPGAAGTGAGTAPQGFLDKLTSGIKAAPTNIVDRLTNNPVSTALSGLSLIQGLTKPKPTDAQNQIAANSQGGPAANAIISSGGTNTPAYAQQTAAIDAGINQNIQQAEQAILQKAANSGMGVESQVVQQQIAKMKQNAETQRQQLYLQAAQQNVNTALSALGIANSGLSTVAQGELASNVQAQNTAKETANIAGLLAGLTNNDPNAPKAQT